MLVKALENVFHGGYVKIKRDERYIVFAIEKCGDDVLYYVLPYGISHVDGEYDPLPFSKEYFEIIADKTEMKWVSEERTVNGRSLIITSFPEWHENNMFVRAGDWNLENHDYKIVRKYKKKYEKIYSDNVNSA